MKIIYSFCIGLFDLCIGDLMDDCDSKPESSCALEPILSKISHDFTTETLSFR